MGAGDELGEAAGAAEVDAVGLAAAVAVEGEAGVGVAAHQAAGAGDWAMSATKIMGVSTAAAMPLASMSASACSAGQPPPTVSPTLAATSAIAADDKREQGGQPEPAPYPGMGNGLAPPPSAGW